MAKKRARQPEKKRKAEFDQEQDEPQDLEVEAKRHKADLELLKEQDPEFYQYLQQTDQELLAFGHSDSEPEDEDEECIAKHAAPDLPVRCQPSVQSTQPVAQDGDAQPGSPGAISEGPEDAGADTTAEAAGKPKTLSGEELARLCASAQAGSLRGCQALLKAYRVACHMSDSKAQEQETIEIQNSHVFNRLIFFMLNEAHDIFCKLLDLDPRAASSSLAGLQKRSRWSQLRSMVKSYLGNTLHLIEGVTDATLVAFALRRVRASATFLVCAEALQRKFLRLVCRIMGRGEAATRIQAFLLLRQMATCLPDPMPSNALKGAYRCFVQNSKFMTTSSAAHIHFLGACVIELYGHDSALAYQHAFSHLSELAQLSRRALDTRTAAACQQVYCWQTVCALELWGRLLGAHAENQELRQLVYPAMQLLLGAVRLVPSPTYYPLHLRLLQALQALSSATGVYCPLAQPLLGFLQWPGLRKKLPGMAGAAPKGSPTAPTLKAGDALLASSIWQQSLVEQVVELMAQHFARWAGSPSMPEMAHLATVQLRKLLKQLPAERFRTAIRTLVTALESSCSAVLAARSSRALQLSDAAALQAFPAAVKAEELPICALAQQLLVSTRARKVAGASSKVEVSDGATAAKKPKCQRAVQQPWQAADIAADDEDDLATLHKVMAKDAGDENELRAFVLSDDDSS